jgi:hypothetical protein
MATIQPNPATYRDRPILHTHQWTWEALDQTDSDGDWVDLEGLSHRTFHAIGGFGGGTLAIQGSHDKVNLATLNATMTNPTNGGKLALTFTAEGLKTALELPKFVRPVLTGGAGSDIDVILVAW